MTGWAPTLAEHWRTEIIDLSEFIGNEIALRFVNICGFGNNLYLDNIIVYEYNTYPQASFSVFPDVESICKGESLVFNNTSFGEDIDNYLWSFGDNSSPLSSDSVAPNPVIFNEPGSYEVSLLVSNTLGWDKSTITIDVLDIPVADFSYNINNGMVEFTNNSVFGSEYYWDFGDGNTSTEENPSHNYDSKNIYHVMLTVTNICGEQSISENIQISTKTIDLEKSFQIKISPNPADQFVDVEWQNVQSNDNQIVIFDITGKKVAAYQFANIAGKTTKRLNVSELSSGIYIIKIQSNNKTAIDKLLIF